MKLLTSHKLKTSSCINEILKDFSRGRPKILIHYILPQSSEAAVHWETQHRKNPEIYKRKETNKCVREERAIAVLQRANDWIYFHI